MSTSYAAFDVLSHGTMLALPLALVAGAVAGLNPCCVVLYPSAAAICCGTNAADACRGTQASVQARGFKTSVAFVFGVAAAATVLGILAALAGRVVWQFGSGVRYAVAAVPLVMGLHLIGWVRLPITSLPHRVIRNGWLGAFGGGFLLSLALTPCGTPVLASVLSYVAYKGSVVYGAMLLFVYGLGSGAPVVLVGTAAGRLARMLERAGYGRWTERISGGALLTLGLLLVWKA